MSTIEPGRRETVSAPDGGRKFGATRRGLLATAAAAGAGLTAARTPSAAQSPGASTQVDAVVVGAGFAGLSAALQIARAGRSVLVLEARDRVGGRVVNKSIGGGDIAEAGGQFIGPTQNRMAALAQAFGVPTFPTYVQGDSVSIFGGVRAVGGLSAAIEGEYRSLVGLLQTMASKVPVAAPWSAADASDLDSLTLQTWLDTNTENPDVKGLFTNFADLWGAEPRDVSLLFVLFYIAAAGNESVPGTLARLLSVQDGAQELRFVGGSQVLAQRIAGALGERIVLSAPVREIQVTESGVLVTSDRQTVEARHVVVAVPPALAAGIHYEPKLPTLRAQLFQRLPMGSLIKITAVYGRPFWRDAGLSGVSLIEGGPVRSTFDNSPPSGRVGVLLGFVGGKQARSWPLRPPAERRAAVLANLAAAFGSEALSPTQYFEADWPGEEWSCGGPVAYAPPGVLLDYGSTIREPVGPIHWAGTETATFWNGYMEGAVRSGERAASEVLSALS